MQATKTTTSNTINTATINVKHYIYIYASDAFIQDAL